ncbi:hypothetical protein C8246_08660 [Paracidovorax avenae]|nr:hypothetical protein C8246_08660 [Paracidovorax avenae]
MKPEAWRAPAACLRSSTVRASGVSAAAMAGRALDSGRSTFCGRPLQAAVARARARTAPQRPRAARARGRRAAEPSGMGILRCMECGVPEV